MIGFGASGFGGTPVTKALLILTLTSSLLFGISKNKLVSMRQSFQIWHLLIYPLTFTSAIELLIGCLILYPFRTFERLFGCRKFASLLVYLFAGSFLIQLVSFCLGRDRYLASGPYVIIFGLFVDFYFIIPAVSSVKVFGVQFSEKLLMYAAGSQLALLNLSSSLLPSLFGIVLGLLHRVSFLPFQKLQIPETVAAFCDQTFGPLLAANATENGAHRQVRTMSNGDVQDSRTMLPPPNENDVTRLVGMGFSEDAVRRALAQTYNDIHRATEILLEGSR